MKNSKCTISDRQSAQTCTEKKHHRPLIAVWLFCTGEHTTHSIRNDLKGVV